LLNNGGFNCLKSAKAVYWSALARHCALALQNLQCSPGTNSPTPSKACAHLKENGIDEALLYDRVPLTVSQIEKVLKTEQFRSLLEEPGLVQKSAGKPTLAPIGDKRKQIFNAPDAASDFN